MPNITSNEPDILSALRFNHTARTISLKRSAQLYSAARPEKIFFVAEGFVKVVREMAGRPVVVDIYGPNDVFGALYGSADGAPFETVEALSECQVSEVTFLEGCDRGAEVSALLTSRLLVAEEWCQVMAAFNIERRLAFLLHRLAERFGDGLPGGEVSLQHFSHETLGQYIGTSREIVTQFMNKFKRSGYVKQMGRARYMVDMKALVAVISHDT